MNLNMQEDGTYKQDNLGALVDENQNQRNS